MLAVIKLVTTANYHGTSTLFVIAVLFIIHKKKIHILNITIIKKQYNFVLLNVKKYCEKVDFEKLNISHSGFRLTPWLSFILIPINQNKFTYFYDDIPMLYKFNTKKIILNFPF